MTDVRQASPPAIVYVPVTEAGAARRILVRAREDAAPLAAPIESALKGLSPGLTVRVRTFRDEIDRAVGPLEMLASVAGILAVFTLTLAALGLAGVTTFAVQLRQREIGIRLALGASRDRVLTLLVRQSLLPVAIGLAAGLAAALAGSGVIRNVLYGIGPRDPLAVAGATGLLILTALVAVILPSGRATRGSIRRRCCASKASASLKSGFESLVLLALLLFDESGMFGSASACSRGDDNGAINPPIAISISFLAAA